MSGAKGQSDNSPTDYPVPPLLSPFGSYPNPLELSKEHRQDFHPVLQFPTVQTDEGIELPNIQIMDLTRPTNKRHLATVEEQELQKTKSRPRREKQDYAIGRYDEDRVGLYVSDLFDDTDNSIDGYQGRRTIHMGMDLDGPLGTPVYAFTDGIIHAVGYNPELGDYGNVIVIQHKLPNDKVVYALYGHLDNASIVGKSKGQSVQKGDVVGHLGDIHENGGWFTPHVHFQLSLQPPATHDMPGAVSQEDRARALWDYPDPRYVLGPLY